MNPHVLSTLTMIQKALCFLFGLICWFTAFYYCFANKFGTTNWGIAVIIFVLLMKNLSDKEEK